MEEIAHQSNGSSLPLEVHKLYRSVEFKLTSVYDAGKFTEKADAKTDDSEALALKNGPLQYEFQSSWKSIHKIGPGFVNVGNTCFLNSVLQMLTYTPPFANYLLEKVHSKKCKKKNGTMFCALCAFESHVNKCFTGSAKTLQPTEILRNIKMINKKFRIGRQEDAQEFLRDLIDAFQKSATGFLEKPPQKVLESTEISRMFGGKLKSTVECRQCHHKSEIYESFFDLSLELSKSESIEKCMEVFFRAEELKGSNKYRCSNCKKLVEATKKFSIHQRPIVLTIHLKRFDNSFMRINKISRHIKFHETISLNPYVSEKTSEPLLYDLQGIVIHMGSFCSSGHYFSYVKNSNGIWYLMNDEDVRTSKIDNVLNQNAYLLTYVLRSSPKKPEIAAAAVKETKFEVRNKTMEVETPKEAAKEVPKKGVPQAKAPVNGHMKAPVAPVAKEEKKEQKPVKSGAQTPREKMVVENVNGDHDIGAPYSKKMKMDEEPKRDKSLGKGQMNGHLEEHEKTEKAEKPASERIFEKLSKVDGSISTPLNGILSQSVEIKSSKGVIDNLFGKKSNKEGVKEAKANGEEKGKSLQDGKVGTTGDLKAQDKVNKNWPSADIEKPKVRESEKIPYSTQLDALLDKDEAKKYMKRFEEQVSVAKKKVEPGLKRTLSVGAFDTEKLSGTPIKKSLTLKPSIMRMSSMAPLRNSPLDKLKRIAKVITLLPNKKRKEDPFASNNANGVKEENGMHTEEVQNSIQVKQQATQPTAVVSQKPIQVKQQTTQPAAVVKKAQKKGEQPLQQQEKQQKVNGNYFMRGENTLKNMQKDIEEWEIGDDGDVDEIKEIAKNKKKLMEENPDFFENPKKEKDAYDAEYDKGKVKKVKKKKKANLKKKFNNFQKTYEYLNR